MKKTVAVFLGTIVFSVAVGAGAAHFTVGGPMRTGQLLPQPPGWVAFQADVTVTHADTGATVVGRYFRSADGSTRLETGVTRDEPLVISIKNVQVLRHYTRGVDGAWASAPLGIMSPADVRPIEYRATLPGLTKYPKKLALFAGQGGSLTATEGLSAYHYVSATFTQQLLVPELNFFAVLRSRPDGRREIYTNISLMEPPRALFELPDGVVARLLDRPSGIVAGGPGAAAARR